MAEYSVIWTVLPNGVDEHGLPRLSVDIAPRLLTAGQLSDYPDWADWPATLAGLKVTVSFPDVPARGLARLVSRPDSRAWRAVFPAATRVDAYQFESFAFRRIRSYPVATVIGYTLDRYGMFGVTHPVEHPSRGQVARYGAFRDIGEDGGEGADEVRAQLEQRYDTGPGSGPERWAAHYRRRDPARPNPAADREAFMDAERFHRRLDDDVIPPGAEPPVPSANQLDFTKATGLAADHPTLQRMLGLVLNLRIEPGGNEDVFAKVFNAAARDTTVTLELEWPDGQHDPVTQRSALTMVCCRVGKEAGGATVFRAQDRPGRDLSAGLLRLGATSQDAESNFTVTVADSDSSALRLRQFAGNAIRRPVDPRAAAAKVGSVAGPEAYPLPALSSGGLSVAHAGRATALAQALAAGAARNAHVFSADGRLRAASSEPMLAYADDLVRGYRWDVYDEGTRTWRSLMEREGRYEFTRDPEINVEVTDEGTSVEAVTSSGRPGDDDVYLHESMVRWDGWSLVVPRPGKAVQEDGSVSNEEPEPDPAFGFAARYQVRPGTLPSLRFGRTYRLRARAVDLAGNSLTMTEADLRADPTLATAPQRYGRFEPVLPPELELASRAGDPEPGHGESVTVAVIRSETGEDPTDGHSARQVNPPRTSVKLAERHGLLPMLGEPLKQYLELSRRDRATRDVFEDFEVDYLPEALVRQVEVRGGPGTLDPVPMATGSWPKARPFRLELRSGRPAGMEFDAFFRKLLVTLEPGDVYELWLSARLTDADLDELALWPVIEKWARDHGIDTAALRASALRGHHWMLTPYRELLLIHAVRRPLLAPGFQPGFSPLRRPGATDTLLAGKLTFCPKSTGTLDLVGKWEMPLDDGHNDDPVTPRPFQAAPHTYRHQRNPGPLPAKETLELSGWTHEFGDTRYRRVSYQVIATSRFLEHFPDEGGPTTQESQPLAVDIPSTLRPAPPQVEYLVPIFKWETDNQGRSVRRAGLRVYLRRPWWSSGPGELLGVVLYGGTGEPPAPAQRYFSHWAADPATPEPHNKLAVGLDVGSFPIAAITATSGVTLRETATQPVHVAGHHVGFDPERDRWYCDLRVTTGRDIHGAEEPIREFFPFLRLALARYQPCSLPDCHLSPVVMADFIQLAPDRFAQIVGSGDTRTVVVSGIAPTRITGSASEFNRVQVTVEIPRPDYQGSENDPLAWVIHDTPVELTPHRSVGNDTEWLGQIYLGAVPAGRRRLVIEEFEPRQRGASAEEKDLGWRLVHTDILELS